MYPPAPRWWDSLDEYDDLVALLLAYRAYESDTGVWLTHAIATAALRNNHLWQDLGLPNRAVLSRLMRENFPPWRHATSAI